MCPFSVKVLLKLVKDLLPVWAAGRVLAYVWRDDPLVGVYNKLHRQKAKYLPNSEGVIDI
jgi:hypothetical protein